jgi:hypothetical protein
MSKVNPAARSKVMVAALTLTTLAFIALVAAYVGEWWTVHIEYPEDFPNDPETDRGFRILKIYWLTFGSSLALLGAVLWALGLLLYLFVGLSRRAPWLSGLGKWCAVFHLILGGYIVLLFLR